jgi:hypothetical protein
VRSVCHPFSPFILDRNPLRTGSTRLIQSRRDVAIAKLARGGRARAKIGLRNGRIGEPTIGLKIKKSSGSCIGAVLITV